ncbi:hypothetical protein JOC54_000165 [Alkalihalobacillus xiaoxiensis]|uniref:Uncharacterized protein n=1 Tax=Shouchella xiaoxiensis TaxID=766895 RepID=A0ABS2SQY7_9BACI|nr:hypothetical protein [Shouchella xiaoxiensis]
MAEMEEEKESNLAENRTKNVGMVFAYVKRGSAID